MSTQTECPTCGADALDGAPCDRCEVARLRAALRDIAAQCDRCNRLATRKCTDRLDIGFHYACDDDTHTRPLAGRMWVSLPHAAALRAAEVTR